MYTTPRCEDISDLLNGINIDGTQHDFKLRLFSGDGPARQFEAGQKRGGHYSCLCGVNSNQHMDLIRCFDISYMTLEERREHVVKGVLWEKIISNNCINPFNNLKKDEIECELDKRGIDIYNLKSKQDLQTKLDEVLHGICRPPALLLNQPQKTTEEHNINYYEVMSCEPLHDLTNVIQNLIVELPNHVTDKSTKTELERFYTTTIGDKTQVKGSDARIYLVRLAKKVDDLHVDGKISEDIKNMINSLVEIQNIAYSPADKRSPRTVLRLYNLTFSFGMLAKTVIGIPEKLTERKFYGSHFHSLVVHLPEIFRIISLRSILAEQEERSFGSLRKIALGTTNRKPGFVVDNTVLRFNKQQNSDNFKNHFNKQDSAISQEAQLLSKKPNTSFPKTLVASRGFLFQSHFRRISDFLLPGQNVWWHYNGKDIIFHDCTEELSSRPEGPPLANFVQTSVPKEQKLMEFVWQTCLRKVKDDKSFSLPLHQIKTKEHGKITYLQTNLKPGKKMA